MYMCTNNINLLIFINIAFRKQQFEKLILQ